MKHGLISVIAVLAFLSSANLRAAENTSVLVKTAALKQQELTETLIGYGTVIPDIGSTVNINLPRAGQVARLLVSAGQIVRSGAPLFEFNTAAPSALGYQQAASALVFAREELTRTEQMVSQQLATQSQLAAARRAVIDAEAALEAQRRLGAGVSNQGVAAPFEGVVVSVTAAQGDRVAAGATVLQLARLSGLRVLLGIEPSDSAKVKVGMAVRVTSVFGREKSLQAKIDQVHGMISPQTQLVDVAVRLGGGALIPGTRVRGEITVARSKAWAVPRSAVLRDAQGAYLFQVNDGHAQRVGVRTGMESGGLVAVNGNVDPKLKVVVLGNYELKDGMAVREAGE